MGLRQHTEFKFLDSWKNCSRDSAHERSMIDSDAQIINFDKVKTDYLNSLGYSEEYAHSVDALGEDEKGHIYLIEFKNGDIKTSEIREKLTDSLLIYCDITRTSISDTRQGTDFVLVYNPEHLILKPTEKRALHLAKLGKNPCPLYDLGKYAGFLVSNAYMMSENEFSENMIDAIKVI